MNTSVKIIRYMFIPEVQNRDNDLALCFLLVLTFEGDIQLHAHVSQLTLSDAKSYSQLFIAEPILYCGIYRYAAKGEEYPHLDGISI